MNPERSSAIDAFLARSGWGGAVRRKLAGDASFRRYERVEEAGRVAVLMDAPPDKEDVRPFLRVGAILAEGGFSAPRVLAQDVAEGFLLLEDLGDDLYGRSLEANPDQEARLYHAAVDVLLALHERTRGRSYESVGRYDEALYAREYALFSEWFLPGVGASNAAGEAYLALWRKLMRSLPPLPDVLVLRDYHADNLLWLPGRNGVAQVGLLDFQDAVIGSPAYDLVSILEDARRDVGARTVASSLERYIDGSLVDADAFRAAIALLGAQRNCKIVGIFSRLAERDGKRQYLSYLPRVWGHLETDLAHPLLKPLKDWMDEHVPAQARVAA